MKLSDYLAEYLVKENIHHVFQVIGGASVHMVHSLDAQKDMELICIQHEQAGAMAAEAYARVTKNMGASMATSGPGMTNLITGIACAYFDSIPSIYITGQVNTNESKQGRKVRQVGFQETDIVDMVKSITKYASQVEKAEDIKYELQKAFYIAREGRQGPVLLDIPMDIQRADINPSKLKNFDPKEGLIRSTIDDSKKVAEKVSRTIELLKKSIRPVIIAGGAIRYKDKVDDFLKLVEQLGIPVVSTWSGIDVVPYDHALYRGQIGVYGNRGANFTVQNSDLIISFGSRLDTRITGGKPETFAREAKKIVIDIDKAELYKKRGLDPDIGIVADIADVIDEFLRSKIKCEIDDWITLTHKWYVKYPSVLPSWRKRKSKVDPYYFMEVLSEKLDNKATVVTDCGGNLTWTIQGFNVRRGQRLYSAMGNSPMGYAFASSIGASIGLGKKDVVCIIGDGGFQMNIQELQTVAHYKIPIKTFILNNHSYGIIKQFQEMYFDSVYIGTNPKSGYSMPDFVKVGKAYGIKTFIIKNHADLKSKMKKVLEFKGPVICEVVIPDDQKLIPKLSFGNPIEDLSPELPRKEFLENMLVEPIAK